MQWRDEKKFHLEYEVKKKHINKERKKRNAILTINYTDHKINFTKLLQCRNLYSF